MSAEALARVQKLVERMLGDLHAHGWIVVPDWNTGEPAQEAVPDSYIAEGVMHAILADPAPLLAALAEGGVLEVEDTATHGARTWADFLDGNVRTVRRRRYVTEWTETP